jgi:proteasome accessory factor B
MAGAASSSSSKRLGTKRNSRSDRRERQVVRILALLRVLSQGRKPSVHDLAAEFHTRRETIYRDLRALQDAGYPVTGDGGRLSHPRLLSGSVPEIRFSSTELQALRTAVAQVQVSLPSFEALHAASIKLNALVTYDPPEMSWVASDVLESWSCGAKDYRLHEEFIAILVEAILRHRRCHVEYKRPPAETSKNYDFDPYRLFLVGGGLYVVGRVPKYEGVVTLSVDRLISAKLSSFEFSVDPSFDPKQYRDQAFGISWQDPERIVLRFRSDQAPYVRERIWHPTQELKALPDGRLEMTFHAGGPFEIRRWILGWGDAVEVISPDHLRQEIRRVAESIISSYE